MNIEALQWLGYLVVAGAALLSAGALFVGAQTLDRARCMRLGALCFAAVGVIAALAVLGYAAGITAAFGAVADAPAAERASMLAQAISDAMNVVALIACAALLPGLTGIGLLWRGSTLPRAAPPAQF